MFDFHEIKKLVELVESNDIGELEVSRFWSKVKIRKRAEASATVQQQMIPMTAAAPVPSPAAPSPAEATASGDGGGDADADLIPIRSPMVGTFYRAPAPDADPYVGVGGDVRPGQVVCIIEAMKLMNEIEAEVGGKVVKVLAENAQPVQYDQTLFLVQEG